METILELKNVTRAFKKQGKEMVKAVDQVSIAVKTGEVFGIVGESGSGKSTIARLITRLLDVSSGEIWFEGENITHLQGAKLRKTYDDMQMVFQNPVGSFDPRKTLGYGIGEGLKNRGVSKKEIREKVETLLMQCGLQPELEDRYPGEVSGGQCQRAAIARALAVNPRLIILDEATSGLDVTVQKQILELLGTLQKEQNLTYIFICHNLALVQMFCDRVAVMYNGKVVEEGVPDEIIWNPQTEYTKNLVEACYL